MKNLIRVMKALSDPNRVRVLKILQGGELCVCEIHRVFNLAQSTVSKHMKILEDAGLVDKKRQGSWMIYSLADNPETEYAEAMLTEMRHWLENDQELQQMRKELPNATLIRDCRLKN